MPQKAPIIGANFFKNPPIRAALPWIPEVWENTPPPGRGAFQLAPSPALSCFQLTSRFPLANITSTTVSHQSWHAFYQPVTISQYMPMGVIFALPKQQLHVMISNLRVFICFSHFRLLLFLCFRSRYCYNISDLF